MLHLFKNLVILLLCSLKAHQNKQRGDNSHTFLGLLPIPVPSHPNKKLSQTDRRNNYQNQQREQKVPKGGKPFIFNHSSLFCSIFKVKQLLLCDHVILLQGQIFFFFFISKRYALKKAKRRTAYRKYTRQLKLQKTKQKKHLPLGGGYPF